MGDRVQLQQVMMNLIINSIDAMKDEEGTRELASCGGLQRRRVYDLPLRKARQQRSQRDTIAASASQSVDRFRGRHSCASSLVGRMT